MQDDFNKRTQDAVSPQVFRICLAEYQASHDAFKLFGAPPGYLGHGQPSLLDRILENPGSTVVFSEIEKGAPPLVAAMFDKDEKTGKYSVKPEIKIGERKFSFGANKVVVEAGYATRTPQRTPKT